MVVNSGSEANDIAWRLAVAATGNDGAIVTEHAYHGVTAALADLSPEEWPAGFDPPAVARIAPPPDADVAGAIERLAQRGLGLAATYLDGGFTSDGIHFPAPEQVEALFRATHAAGGLFVADEVQAGHGRTGEDLWSFQSYGVVPDLVTLGKPMGNGYPVAALITRSEIAAALGADLFSTFGGNPVAAGAALAVLDVIEDERLIDNAARVGAHLLAGLTALRERHRDIVDVRGRGLLVGVELAEPSLAQMVVDRMREDGVLIGRTGRHENVLKIRPPLVFANEDADDVAEAVERAVTQAKNR
jgi:4-aminobutyrate aminotransferase-like enzyme